MDSAEARAEALAVDLGVVEERAAGLRAALEAAEAKTDEMREDAAKVGRPGMAARGNRPGDSKGSGQAILDASMGHFPYMCVPPASSGQL